MQTKQKEEKKFVHFVPLSALNGSKMDPAVAIWSNDNQSVVNFDWCRLVISLFSFTLPILIGAGFKVRAFISSQEVSVSTEKVDLYLVLKKRGCCRWRFLSFALYRMLKVEHKTSWLQPERGAALLTEANGDSVSTYKRGPWLVCWARCAGTSDFGPIKAALVGPVQKKISSPYTISLYLFLSPSKLGRQSCRVACLWICVFGCFKWSLTWLVITEGGGLSRKAQQMIASLLDYFVSFQVILLVGEVSSYVRFTPGGEGKGFILDQILLQWVKIQCVVVLVQVA